MVLSAVLAAYMLWPTRRGDTLQDAGAGAQACVLLYLLAAAAAWVLAYRMTIEVDAHALRWRIGVGILSDSYSLREIEAANLVATALSILPRMRRAGVTRLVSVAPGRRAVEILLADGCTIVLGTNDGEALIAALEASKRGPE
jgi:hypothetical protein